MKKIAGIFFVTILMMSCATLFNPKKVEVSFSSEPEGAAVYVNGHNMGKSRCLNRNALSAFSSASGD